ncbi:unnamed protein product [Adineta steineri]|uniref:F-box domain-containing protein n=1 Tax=Adineta steineri TaxID=433720 RepID=A0A819KHB2_9BILA|nr:unnamed protein product [Adineta steineri]CAF3944673.1 unnamed protein product [Adineta steineri]
MTHEHCDKCFLINCLHSSSCPVIFCPHGCFARMHECKRNDHEHICPNIFTSCLNANYGCPMTIRRCNLTKHLRVCPASITVCTFIYNHDYHFDKLDNTINDNLIQTIALRDNIWYEHMTEFEKKQKELYPEIYKTTKNNKQGENLIRSEKYRYITMPECMLDRGDGAICSTCRNHLRHLEDEEEERLSGLTPEEQEQMAEFNLNYNTSSEQRTTPSLVKMSSTLINSSDISQSPPASPSIHSTGESSTDYYSPMPLISDTELPTSHIYRLNYFSSNQYPKTISTFNKSPRFYCHALCRRDEMEQHWLAHFHVDCILNTSLIQQCPKSQYGCTFQYERLEPCRIDGESIRIRFDQTNDAVAFEWYPTITVDPNKIFSLLDLPSEILEKILLELDSLSLRNISLVSRRLRALCEDLLPSRGIVITEYERNQLIHGDITWLERKKHWLFTNTSSAVPKWQLKIPNKLTSMNQHMITCPYGEKKDLENEPRFELIGWANRNVTDNSTE